MSKDEEEITMPTGEELDEFMGVPSWWNATDREYYEMIARLEAMEDPMEVAEKEHNGGEGPGFWEEDEGWK